MMRREWTVNPHAGARMCACGHRLGIHEYPGRCNGAVSYPDDNTCRCECWHDFPWDAIRADRELLDTETHDSGEAVRG